MQDIRGTIKLQSGDVIEFTSDNVYGDVVIYSQCVKGSGFSLGSVCSAECNMTFILNGISRYNVIGAAVSIEIADNSGNWHKAGIYNVVSATRYYNNITVKAVDNMIFLDKQAYTVDENSRKLSQIAEYLKTQRTIYEALKYTVEIAGLLLGNTQEEIEAFKNAEFSTMVFQEVDTDCPRDWLSWIAEFLGGFAYADENGKIRIKQFEITPTATIYQSEIQSDTSDIADFTIKLARVGIVTYNKSWGYHYSIENDGKPNTINIDLSDNIISQGMHYIYLYSMNVLKNIYNAVASIPYRPFNATVHSDDVFNLGQCISIEDYDGQIYNTVITNITYTLNGGYQLKCAGEDTRLLADTKRRTALKRESEKLQMKINEAKGMDLTQSALDQLEADGKLTEGMTYYVKG